MKKILVMMIMVAGLGACGQDTAAPVVRQCGSHHVEMRFADDGDVMHATIDGCDVTLNNAVSASGAKYDGVLDDDPVSLWGKGDDWIMLINDMVIECVAK